MRILMGKYSKSQVTVEMKGGFYFRPTSESTVALYILQEKGLFLEYMFKVNYYVPKLYIFITLKLFQYVC